LEAEGSVAAGDVGAERGVVRAEGGAGSGVRGLTGGGAGTVNVGLAVVLGTTKRAGGVGG